jgi:hypothetical protein
MRYARQYRPPLTPPPCWPLLKMQAKICKFNERIFALMQALGREPSERLLVAYERFNEFKMEYYEEFLGNQALIEEEAKRIGYFQHIREQIDEEQETGRPVRYHFRIPKGGRRQSEEKKRGGFVKKVGLPILFDSVVGHTLN